MASDARVPMAPCLDAFGVAATVTRPYPDDTPIETTVAWVGPGPRQVPAGAEWSREEMLKVLGLSRLEVPTVPNGTRIVAAERLGEAAKTWQVDGLVSLDPDETRVSVVEVACA